MPLLTVRPYSTRSVVPLQHTDLHEEAFIDQQEEKRERVLAIEVTEIEI
jgi:hypothetical protein